MPDSQVRERTAIRPLALSLRFRVASGRIAVNASVGRNLGVAIHSISCQVSP